MDWPATAWWLLDANQRRTDFLTEAVQRLGVADRVTVVRGRAEELGHDGGLRGRFELVVARSFGKPAVTAECAAGFLKVGGTLMVSEPPATQGSESGAAGEGPRWDPVGLAELGLALGGHQAGCQVLHAHAACPDRYPRRVGIPTKRPLFG